MIDWHSHILPAMDDGSRDVEESLSMLKALAEQGVDHVVATPHFYAGDEMVSSFLERRERSATLLEASLTSSLPHLVYGAEVRYYSGISRMEDLSLLQIGKSKLFLLEMDMTSWTEYTVRELTELAGFGNLTVVLAHIERYLAFQSPRVWERLYECGILMQVNASFFKGFANRHKALKMLDREEIHFIGSDCHNMTTRPPQIGEAYGLIEKKLGKDFISELNEYGRYMLFR